MVQQLKLPVFHFSLQPSGKISVCKKLLQIFALLLPMFLVACGSSSSTGTGADATSTTGFAGTYNGSVSGINAGPATIAVSSANVVTGNWTITNRDGGPYYVTFKGTVDADGKLKADAYIDIHPLMTFNGTLNASTGAMSGTWYENDHPELGGAFSMQGSANGTVTTTTTGGSSAASCTGSFVGTYDAPSHEERIRLRNLSLVNNGKVVTGDDATDNAAAGGGGVDGGIYMTGSYAFETDSNCNVVKGTTMVFYVYQYDISGKVNSDGSFALTWSGQGSTGELAGKADANNAISGKFYHPAPDSFVYGTMGGTFTPNGKI